MGRGGSGRAGLGREAGRTAGVQRAASPPPHLAAPPSLPPLRLPPLKYEIQHQNQAAPTRTRRRRPPTTSSTSTPATWAPRSTASRSSSSRPPSRRRAAGGGGGGRGRRGREPGWGCPIVCVALPPQPSQPPPTPFQTLPNNPKPFKTGRRGSRGGGGGLGARQEPKHRRLALPPAAQGDRQPGAPLGALLHRRARALPASPLCSFAAAVSRAWGAGSGGEGR